MEKENRLNVNPCRHTDGVSGCNLDERGEQVLLMLPDCKLKRTRPISEGELLKFLLKSTPRQAPRKAEKTQQ
jgi:hypothetical protein